MAKCKYCNFETYGHSSGCCVSHRQYTSEQLEKKIETPKKIVTTKNKEIKADDKSDKEVKATRIRKPRTPKNKSE